MNSNKILALTVLAAFLLSVIPAIAVTGGGTDALRDKVTAATANITEIRQVLVTAARTLSEAKQNYVQVRQEYAQAKQDWVVVKGKFADKNRTAFEKGQTFLAQGTKELIHYIDVLTQKVEETNALTYDQRTSLTNELAGYRSTLENDRSLLLSVNTTDELRAAANLTKDDWSAIRPQLKRIAGELLLSKSEAVVAKAEAASIKLDAKIAELKAAGNDTTRLEKISAQVKTKIANAKDKIAQAKAKLADVKSGGNVQGLLTAADQFVKQANRWMLEMQYLLGQAVREVKHIETGRDAPEIKNATIMVNTPISPDEESGG